MLTVVSLVMGRSQLAVASTDHCLKIDHLIKCLSMNGLQWLLLQQRLAMNQSL